jgi:hypothetical protein
MDQPRGKGRYHDAVMPSQLQKAGSTLLVIQPSIGSYIRSRRVALAGASLAFLALLGALIARLARLAMGGTVGLLAGATIIGLVLVAVLTVVALEFLRNRVIALPGELAVRGALTTQRVPAAEIQRVLFRTISYSGNTRREIIVVGASNQVLCRVLADFYRDDDLRGIFAALGVTTTGSWSDVITLGPVEGLTAAQAITAHSARDRTA